MTKAVANTHLAQAYYKSQAEAAFAQVATASLADRFHARVLRLDYEPFTLNMPGNRYTPDFYAIFQDGRVMFIEVKASRQQKNYRDARSKLRAAAALHPEFTWVEATVTRTARRMPSVELEIIETGGD